MDEHAHSEPADEADDDKSTDAPGSPLPKKQKNDPDSWNVATSCFDVVKYFAREGITDEIILEHLDRFEIHSLEILKESVAELAGILKEKISGQFVNKIDAAMARTKMKPAEILGGKLEFDASCITEAALRLYEPEAVSINQSPSRSTDGRYDRIAKFTLVMGPSGSGKTMYSLEGLPETVYPGAISDKIIFRIHLKASKLLGSAPDAAIDLPGQVVKYVTDEVAGRLSPTFGKVVVPIDLYLFVVIDEAGETQHSTFFDKAEKIDAIAEALGKMDGGYKFEKGVHVVVTGTSLETTTKDICSCPEAIKIRMQPLSLGNFVAMLSKLDRKDKGLVEKMVQRFPMLSRLTANARCANLLARLIPNLSHATEQRWAGFVDVSVANVARSYSEMNGLGNLTQPEQKFIVVQEAFKALDNAMAHSTVVSFPKFDHINDDELRSVTQSLLDINVEIISGKAHLIVNQLYSVSMTPAITIVLAELLCEKAALSWNWQGLENTAALGEWKRMITRIEVSDYTNACGIIYMQSPAPHGRAKYRFTLPVVSRSTVLLNGPAAPYADVMAPFRLVQVKFSENVDQDRSLAFQDEIGKMGLTTDDGYELKQAITSVLYVMWQQPRTGNDADYIDKVEMLVNNEQERCEHCPYQSLSSLFKSSKKTASFFLEKGKPWQLSPDKGDPAATALLNLKPIQVLEEFTNELPVTAVFVTNCKRFALTDKYGKTVETVARGDVDWKGKLKIKKLPKDLVSTLRKNVEIAFLFY